MSTSKFLKKLTAAEVGNTKTHEVYIRIPNDFDFESFFNHSHIENGSVVEVNFTATVSSKIIDTITPQSYDLRFVFFANSNKEKRIPGLGPLFKAYKVEEGDVVCLEKKEDNSYSLTFFSPDTLQIYSGGLLLNGSLDDNSTEEIVRLNDYPLQQIYFGAPGTGKSHRIKQVCREFDHYRITFHPDTDYASFVGSYKPTVKPVKLRDVTGKVIMEDGEEVTEDKINYSFVKQAFLNAYIAAWKEQQKETPQPVFLVIEEINRGNCAQIFGDIFQLLDRNESGFSDYPIIADNDLKKELAKEFKTLDVLNAENINCIYEDDIIGKVKSGSHLLLPNNLYIWATMNTSDQSLFPIDSAFKRRWDWKYVKIADSGKGYRIAVNGNEYDWWKFINAINKEIGETTSQEDKKLGYFFVKAAKKENGQKVISAEKFLSKVLFYIYADVYKDYGFDDDIFKDENGKPMEFSDYFDEEGNAMEAKIEKFLKNLEVEPISVKSQIDEIEDAEIIESDETERKSSSKLVVKFTDGSMISEKYQFDTYLKALEIIGLENAETIAKEKKYTRRGEALITKDPSQAIMEDSVFSYVNSGDYYVIKGISLETQMNFLNLLSQRLDLGLQVYAE